MLNAGLAKKINIACLLLAIAVVLVLPLKKEIWYDESISILCSKGIDCDLHTTFANTTTINSATLEQLNNVQGVYKATILDNGNSFLYNICLHWFTMLFGNSITAYMLLSKLCSIAALLAFYALCNFFFNGSIFTSLATLLLATDLNFTGMSHEIRAYAMGTTFIVLASVYFYKFMYENEKPTYLFFIGLFSVAAVLSHYLSVYAILVMLGYLVFTKRASLFSVKNMAALIIPVLLVAIYFYFAITGLRYMSRQNETIAQNAAALPFSTLHVLYRSMAMMAVDFKVVFSAFGEKKIAVIIGFLVVAELYITALKAAANSTEKRNLHLLFLLGISGSVFLAALCFKSHHYTALYNRYHSFCTPFACLFTAYAMYLVFKNPKINTLINGVVFLIVIIPSLTLFFLFLRKTQPIQKYNHIALAKQIENEKITKIEVPDWEDAFLIQAVLPRGYKIDYVLNKSSLYFTLYKANATEKVSIVRSNL